MSLTKISNNSLSAISTLPASIPTGALTLLSTQTASSSASIEFTSGIDSTYDSYVFKFINLDPSGNNLFTFQGSTDGGSTYGVTITSTSFKAYHAENDSAAGLTYDTGNDLAQSTNYQRLAEGVGAGADESCSGYLQIFNPSSNTFVKHFIARISAYEYSPYMFDYNTAGYFNTTSPINAFDFKFNTGTFDGIIKMYGVS